MGGSHRRDATDASALSDVPFCPHGLAGSMHRRSVGRRWLAAFCLLIGGLLLCSSPALALSQRGHAFSFPFGAAGKAESQFENPAGVAVHEVNTSTDEVYVVDRGNNRVEQFKCTVAEKTCTFLSQFEVPSPEGIAVDNSAGASAGDVYVTDTKNAEHGLIYKYHCFSTPGPCEKITVLKAAKQGSEVIEEFGNLHGVAVDSKGTLWVFHEETLVSLSDAKINQFSSSLSVEAGNAVTQVCPRQGLAVSPNAESFYIIREEVDSEGSCPGQEEGGKPGPPRIAKLNSKGEVLSEELEKELAGGETTTAAAVELSRGTVYLDNEKSVSAFSLAGSFIQRFGSEQLTGGSGIAVSSSSEDIYVADAQQNRVDVFTPLALGPPTVDGVSSQNITPSSTQLSAQINPNGFATTYTFQYGTVDCKTSPSSCAEVPVPPGQLSAGVVDQEVSVKVANLQPGTTYFYRVLATNKEGTGESAQTVNTFTTLPTSVGVLADHRAWELVSPPNKHGNAIEAIPGEEGLVQASEDGNAISYLADGPIVGEPESNRAIERSQILATRSGEGWSSQDMQTPHETASGIVSGLISEYQFFSADLSLGLAEPFGLSSRSEPPLAPAALEKTLYLRDNPPISPGAAEQANYTEAEKDRAFQAPGFLPLVSTLNVPPNTQIAPNLPSRGLEFDGATPDLSHVVLESRGNGKQGVALTTAEVGPESNLYEWTGGALQLISVLPEEGGQKERPAPEPSLGEENFDVRHAISNEGTHAGTRIFWSNEANGQAELHLYMRDTATTPGKTIQLDTVQGGEPCEVCRAQFQAASGDGSKVFFLDPQRLTKDSTALAPLEASLSEPGKRDLYECEVTEEAGNPACKLKDLTVEKHLGEHAAVQGVMLGAGDDGSYVYFVANGVLAPGAAPGHCVDRENVAEAGPPGATCNLYTEHYEAGAKEWKTTFIATLSNEDARGWEELTNTPKLKQVDSRVSPNGHYLAFMSQLPLTGYNNTDRNSGLPDEEVFLYNAIANRLVCASCNPSGAPPVGVFDNGVKKGEAGKGLLVDRSASWSGHSLAGSIPGWAAVDEERASYQSRYLTDNGRLYFNSPDELVRLEAPNTGANHGVENVYQYEPQGLGSCETSPGCVALISSGTAKEESAFLDASASGNDVFFLTSAQLAPQDQDGAFDVYDARVCNTPEASSCLLPPPPPPVPCNETPEHPCKAPSAPPPGFGAPPSATSSGPGNVSRQETLPFTVKKPPAPTRAQLLAKALKSCKKQKQKKRRVACERSARKRYGAKKAKKSAKRAKKASR
jgi:hypothetical protein